MKKLFLLLLAGISLHAMENDDNDNNNNNNNDVSNQALIAKIPDYMVSASYFIYHRHVPKKKVFGGTSKKFKTCIKHYVQDTELKNDECPERENEKLVNQKVVLFYNRDGKQVSRWDDFGGRNTKQIKKQAYHYLDPSARPEVRYGIFWTMMPPFIDLYDEQYNFIGQETVYETIREHNNGILTLTNEEKDILSKSVDISKMVLISSKSAQAKEIVQKTEENKKAQKALKKEKK